MEFKEEQKSYLLFDLQVHQDSRGLLYEVLHESDIPANMHMRQVYVVADPVRNTIRAFHKHEKLWDFFHIVKGSALFCLVGKNGETERVVLSERKPQILFIPSGVYHGWMSLEDNTILVSIGSEEYDRDDPDEKRVKWDHFDDSFMEKYNSLPFEVERK